MFKVYCPNCNQEANPIKRHPGYYYCHNPSCNMTGFEAVNHVTRTQHINEVNALRSQNKLK